VCAGCNFGCSQRSSKVGHSHALQVGATPSDGSVLPTVVVNVLMIPSLILTNSARQGVILVPQPRGIYGRLEVAALWLVSTSVNTPCRCRAIGPVYTCATSEARMQLLLQTKL
jgi:hypothetical protein